MTSKQGEKRSLWITCYLLSLNSQLVVLDTCFHCFPYALASKDNTPLVGWRGAVIFWKGFWGRRWSIFWIILNQGNDAGWWFQPIWTIVVKLDHSPSRDKDKTYLKPPPRIYIYIHTWYIEVKWHKMPRWMIICYQDSLFTREGHWSKELYSSAFALENMRTLEDNSSVGILSFQGELLNCGAKQCLNDV